MAVTRINNNQISDASAGNVYLGINAAVKLQNYSITATKIANNLTYGSDLTVTGNLTVQGNTTTIDTTYTTIEDPILLLASNQTGTPTVDIGFVGQRGTSNNIAFVWDESAGEFVTVYTTTGESNTVISIASYANIHVSNANIDGNMVVNGTTSFVGNILGNVNLTGNVTLGNVLTSGQVSAGGNVTGGNVLTGGLISSTGNITSAANIAGGNLLATTTVSAVSLLGSTVSASANITGGNVLTGGQVSSTGNITSAANIAGGNLSATSNVISAGVSASGNISGGNLLTSGQVSSTGNITSAANIAGGNLSATTTVSAVSFIGTIASLSGNVIAANINSGNVNTTNVYATNGTFTNNVLISGTLTSTSNIVANTSGIFYGNAVTGNGAIYAGVPGYTFLGSDIVIQSTGNVNNYSQINFQNINNGTRSSTDFVLTADNGNDSSNFFNMGITGSNWDTTQPNSLGNALYANDGYLYADSGNVVIGTVVPNDHLKVIVGGSDSSYIVAEFHDPQTPTTTTTTGTLTVNGGIGANGNIYGNIISGSGNIVSSSNVSGGNLIATTTVSGASVLGTIVSASGNVTAGNVITGGQVSATGNITSAANIAGGNLVATTAVVTPTVIGSTVTISSTGGLITLNPSSNVSVSSKNINSLADPVQAQDAATKAYVDNLVSTQIAYHQPVYAATTTTLETATGGTITYTQPNGAGNGVGATLTVSGGTFNLIDTANIQTANTRVLVKNQANAALNGIYYWANATALIRTLDADTYGPNSAEDLSINDYFFVQSGNVNAGSAWVVNEPTGTITFGTSNISFAQFSSSQTYSAGNGISLVGTVITAKVDNNTTAFDVGGNIIVKAGANLTTPNIGAATGTSLSVTGNLSGAGVSASGNVLGGNLVTQGNVDALSGFVNAAAVITSGRIQAGTSISATGNITGGNILTPGLVSATGNINTAGTVIAAAVNAATIGNTGAALSGATVSASANITGGNILTGGLISATGNISSAGNITASYYFGNGSQLTGVSANTSGFPITAGTSNIAAATNGNIGVTVGGTSNVVTFATTGEYVTGVVSATGDITSASNVNGGNLNATGLSLSGNVVSNLNVSGNVAAPNVSVTSLGNGQIAIAYTNGLLVGGIDLRWDFANASLWTTNLDSNGAIRTTGTVSATGNVTGGNILTSGLISATGDITSAANVNAGNINATTTVSTTSLVGTTASLSGNITGANLNTGGANGLTLNASTINSNASRIVVNSNSSAVDFAVNGGLSNVLYVNGTTNTVSIGSSTQTTNAILALNATNSFLMPVGNTGQRPGTGVTGMLRFNSTLNAVEVYDNSAWATVGTPSFTVIADEQFTGNGVQTVFTLSSNAYTTNSVIVSINGIVQIPTTAYAVSGTSLTFTEAPQTGDLIDVREIVTTTQVTSIANSPGNAVVAVNPTSNEVSITGNLVPVANNVQSLGSPTLRWKDLYVSGNTITMGNVVMKNVAGGNTIGFYGPDGTTPATIASTSIDTTTISNGTSNVAVASSGGNIRINVGGTSNVAVFDPTGVVITGNLTVTGNATLTGNILGDRVQNGTTSFDIQTAGGNANITIGGTSNVVVWSTAGQYTTGLISASGNITSAANISGNYLLGNAYYVTGLSPTQIYNGNSNVTIATSAGNVAVNVNGSGIVTFTTAGIINNMGNGVGNIGNSTSYFNTVFAKATSAQYADLAENYVADAEYEPGTVLSFGGDQEVTVSTTSPDSRIAGVVSTNPSYIMNSTLDGEHVVTIALTGRVPTKVSGPVAKGDMMVSAGNGRAVACATPAMGTVIGKALENHSGGDGIIEVVVGRL